MNAPSVPALLMIVGPPAVGKMTVGHEIAIRTGFRLFTNHHTIELALRFFSFGSAPFNRLIGEFRRRIFEEVAASDLPGLIFTYVWAFDDPRDAAAVEGYSAPFRQRGARIIFAELEASQAERLRRNATDFRLAEKPSKRDMEASARRLLEADEQYQLSSRGVHDERPDYLRLDTTTLAAATAAELIITHFGLPRVNLEV